jgi:integrase
MPTVSPRLWRAKWVVDLRGFGFGQRHVLAIPGDASEVEAIHAAYALLERLRRGSAAESPPQPALLGAGLDGQALFTAVAAQWAERKQYRREGSKRYGLEYLRLLRKELGPQTIGSFEPPAGDDLCLRYVRKLRDEGYAEKTQRNRLSTLFQILHFAQRRGWLKGLPHKPSTEAPAGTPEQHEIVTYTEADFRRLRAEIFSGVADNRRWGGAGMSAEKRADIIARRRLYLSFAFYCGLHTIDLDRLVADHALVDIGRYLRRNSKSARWVKEAIFTMPEQLLLDCEEELRRLGRDWQSGEKIAGGPWGRRGPAVMRVAAEHLGLPPVDFRIFRKSCAREYALRGWNERDVSEILGHVDQRMIREVYLRVPVEMRSPVKVDWTVESSTFPWLSMRRPRRVIPYTEFSDALRTAVGHLEMVKPKKGGDE